jgi:hypothetical protein
MHGSIFAILALVLSATATASIAQGLGQETLSADPRTRCAELVAFWQRHGGKSEGGGRRHSAQERRGRLRGRPLGKRNPGDGILKGEFTIDGRLCPPGTMLYHPDPHFEGAFHTATGGEIVQCPGPSTGERPIYTGRFNMGKRKSLAEERVDL